jgi:hypothetical protein
MINCNPTKNSFIGATALGLLTLVSTSQYAAGADTFTSAQATPFSITAEAGTLGMGGTLGWRFVDNLGVETGFDYFGTDHYGKIKDNNYSTTVRFMSQPLNVDVYPWDKSSFHIAIGALFNENRLSGNASGNLLLNNAKYNGNLSLVCKQDLVDPYLGVGGNFYFDDAHHWSLMGAIGCAYVGGGSTDLTASGKLNKAQQAGLITERNKLKSVNRAVEFWPVIKLGITYSF